MPRPGRTLLVLLVLALAFAAHALPAHANPREGSGPDEKPAGDADTDGTDDETADGEERIRSDLKEEVVVSASATARKVLDAPAAVDVIPGEALEARPADHIADQLRRVPGINVVQFSARDVNIASRGATGGINNSTLALTDGRSLYQDFLGFVMWEFAPKDPTLVDRVEVVRGPASSLWGANAVGGLVHVITKSPRETLGGRLLLEGGSFSSRRVDVTQSFLAGPWAMRVSGGFYESDPFPRPETIENWLGEEIDPDLGLISGDIRDSGTEQPRLDLRADWDGPKGGTWTLQGGWARTRGWIATGLGPFDVDSGTSLSYLQGRYRKGTYEAQVDFNYFDGRGQNLINAILFDFASATSHANVHGTELLGQRTVLGWGADAKVSEYDLSIAPEGSQRTQLAGFAELDVGLLPKLRLIAGARWDWVEETIGSVVSPRAALRYKPHRDHTLRLAWGRAFRSPSVIESDLSVPVIPVAILEWEQVDQDEVGFPFFAPFAQAVCSLSPDNCGVAPGEVPDYIAVTAARGSRELEEEETESLEVGWAARFGRFGVQLSLYRTVSDQAISFQQQASYGNGPDGQPGTADDIILPSDPNGDGIAEAPPLDVCPLVNALEPFTTLCPLGPVTYNEALSYLLDGAVPSLFAYENLATEEENRGVELGFDFLGKSGWSVYANYSWQDAPEIDGRSVLDIIDNAERETIADTDLDGDGLVGNTADFVNVPAEHRVSLGFQIDRARWFAAVSYDWVDRTFWQDVLTSDFWGWVPKYTLVGARAGYRWPGKGLELAVQGTNLLDDAIQQHIYADIIDRRVAASLTYRWTREKPAATAP